MTKYIFLTLSLGLVLSATVFGSDGLVGRKVPLVKATHINSDIASWDTVYADIMDSTGGTKVTTVGLQTIGGDGRWYGAWTPSVIGNYVINYVAVYGADSVIEEDYLEIRDTAITVSVSVSESDAGNIAAHVKDTADAYPGIFLCAAAGSGSDTANLYVLNATDTSAFEGVTLTVLNTSHTTAAVSGVNTDINGMAQVLLDPETYHVYAQRLGVVNPLWDTITVPSGGMADTIWASAYDPGAAPSPSLTRVVIYSRDLNYENTKRLATKVSTSVGNVVDTTNNVLIDFITVVSYSHAGSTLVDLIPSINLVSWRGDVMEDSVRYNFTIFRSNTKVFERKDIFIPRSESAINLFTLFAY